MKFTTYNQQVAPASSGVAKLQVSSDPNAYGGNGAGLTAMAKGVQQLAAGIEAHNENEDKMTYTEAMNELDKRRNSLMFDGDNAYMKRMLKDSVGSSQAFEDDMRKQTEEVAKQFKFKTPAYKLAFMNSAQRSNMEGYKMVNKREYEQGEAYKDVLDKESDDNDKKLLINGGYNSNSILSNALTNIRFNIDRRFSSESQEVRDIRYRERAGSMVGVAVSKAIQDNNYGRARTIAEENKNILSPEVYAKVTNSIQSNEKKNAIYTFAKNAADSKMKPEDFKAMVENGEVDLGYSMGNANVEAGIDYARKSIGQQLGANQCANFTSRVIEAMGGDPSLTSSLADGMYRNAEVKGLTFNDRNQLKDGDAVYWQVKGSSYTPSNDPNAVNSDKEAYMGITHVGVYDAKTGKVIQSGNSGVKEMDMDTDGYTVVGFSHVKGAEQPVRRKLTIDEQKEAMKEYESIIAQQNRIHNQNVNDFEDLMYQEAAKHQSDPNGVAWIDNEIKKREDGNPENTDYAKALKRIKSNIFGGSGSSGTAGGVLAKAGKTPSPAFQVSLAEMLKTGRFMPKDQNGNTLKAGEKPNFMSYVKSTCGVDNAAAVKMASDMYEDYTLGKGAFSYKIGSINTIVDMAMAKDKTIKPEEREWVKDGAKIVAYNYIQSRRGVEEPRPDEIVREVYKALALVRVGTYKRADKYMSGWEREFDVMARGTDIAAAGISGINNYEGDGFSVREKDENGTEKSVPLSGEELDSRLHPYK